MRGNDIQTTYAQRNVLNDRNGFYSVGLLHRPAWRQPENVPWREGFKVGHRVDTPVRIFIYLRGGANVNRSACAPTTLKNSECLDLTDQIYHE
jgi:hypothetical protein